MQPLNKDYSERLFSRYLSLMRQLRDIYKEGMIIARKSENLLVLINSGLADNEILSLITGDASAKRKSITTEPTENRIRTKNIPLEDALLLMEENPLLKELEMPDGSVARMFYHHANLFHYLSIIRHKDFSITCIQFLKD